MCSVDKVGFNYDKDNTAMRTRTHFKAKSVSLVSNLVVLYHPIPISHHPPIPPSPIPFSPNPESLLSVLLSKYIDLVTIVISACRNCWNSWALN